ncbi:MAG TPA: hypothetical protein VFS67_35170 [Polyangiaceae bacterium]|nr:hypothetical protein [Polyangiaceae bacterium]
MAEHAHPDTPLGGGGPGHFRAPGPRAAERGAASRLPQPGSPAARIFDWGRLGAFDRAERIEAVYEAVQRSARWIPGEIQRATGEEVHGVIEGILPGLAVALGVAALTTTSGAVVGAALGALAGGVGALPGAAVGGAWGAEAGVWILEWLGLGFLAVSVGRSLGHAARLAELGVRDAWNAPVSRVSRELAIDQAAAELARAVAHVVRAILQGIVALLLSKGAEAAQARVAELTAQLRSSRLGARFATWVEQGWQRLITNPKLQPSQIAPAPRTGGAAKSVRDGEAAAAPASTVRRVPVSSARLQARADGALHNRDWTRIDVKEFKATRPEGLDMDRLSASEQRAVATLRSGGYSPAKIEQILNSGKNFAPRQFKQGEQMYAFDSADYVGKDADSPFWLDKTGFQDVQARFERDGVWDRQGVKDYLALPCFNKADGIVQGTVARDCVGVQSTVGPATENVSYIAVDGTVVPGAPSLPGGGPQLSPPVGSILP